MTTVLVAAMLLPAGLLVLLAGRRLLVVITVVGHSMQPTYQPGDRLLMLRSRRLALRPGAVVVFAPPRQPYGGGGEQVPPSFLQPGELLVKRVVAGPGDATPEPVLASPGAQERVPAGHVVVLSDLQGYDSRFFGYLPLDEVRRDSRRHPVQLPKVTPAVGSPPERWPAAASARGPAE